MSRARLVQGGGTLPLPSPSYINVEVMRSVRNHLLDETYTVHSGTSAYSCHWITRQGMQIAFLPYGMYNRMSPYWLHDVDPHYIYDHTSRQVCFSTVSVGSLDIHT